MYAGPLPSPKLLAEFETLVPGSAERIIGRWEKQSDHRMALERQVVDGNIKAQRLGLIIGAILVAFVSVMAALFFANGASGAAASTVIAELVALAGVFVYARSRQESERRSRDPRHRANGT
jgi:uncharacterized membrane protein